MIKTSHFITSCALILACFSSVTMAQNENSLDFDNIDDNVIVQNASSLIAGSAGASISLWVYPENPSPTFPDFDGIAGFRNELDADFYILHLNTTTVEVRLRNSGGQDFTMNYSGILLNTWQHFVFMYDGTNMKLYHNGDSVSSIPVQGNIINPAVPLTIGNLQFQITNFYHSGKIDEVSLWNRSLSSGEVRCIYKNDVDTSSTGLQLYYKFNQGISGGNNTAQFLLVDEMGNSNGVLSNFSLNGTSSNFVDGVINYDSTFISVCQGESVQYGGQSFNTSGSYPVVFVDTEGCDSTVVLKLDVLPVDTIVSRSGITLMASSTGTSYQWVNCDNNFSILSGETSQNFTPSANGNYAVIITQFFCTDTSNCHNVNSVGIETVDPASVITIYPNPASNQIDFNANARIYKAEVYSIDGRLILVNESPMGGIYVDQLPEGIYHIKLISADNIFYGRFQVLHE